MKATAVTWNLTVTHFHELKLAVTCIYRVSVVARIRLKLPAVDRDRKETEGAVGILHVFAVLPLYYSLRT